MSSTVSNITVSDLLAEMRRLADSTGNFEKQGMTSKEIRIAMGTGDSRTSRLIDEALAAGLLSCRRTPRLNRVGEISAVPAYFATQKTVDPDRKRKKR